MSSSVPLYPHSHASYNAFNSPRSPSNSATDASPPMDFDDNAYFSSPQSEPDQMLFGPLEIDDRHRYDPGQPWENSALFPTMTDSSSPHISSTQFDYQASPLFSHSPLYDPDVLAGFGSVQLGGSDYDDNKLFANWINDPEVPAHVSSTLPMPIPPSSLNQPAVYPFHAYAEHQSPLSNGLMFSPSTNFSNLSMTSSAHDPNGLFGQPMKPMLSSETIQPPTWASHLWDTPSSVASPLPSSPIEEQPLSDDANATIRQQHVPIRKRAPSLSQVFQSSSAPSALPIRSSRHIRPYSTRAESPSENDATVRRTKRSLGAEESRNAIRGGDRAPQKSELRPPKLAPSAWQLYFTDWIQRHQERSDKKLNVAQAAKEAGIEYGNLSQKEKQPWIERSQAAKEIREREYDAYLRSLTPDEIKRENQWRTAQRKAGKSRKGNIKDPNAPKKPLSAYFMFLQRIRSDPELVKEVFGDETETTKQSVLAAAKWREMTDEERKPFLARAEQEKMEYETARRLYEEGTVGFETSINFSILPGDSFQVGSPWSKSAGKLEASTSSESESDGFATDDGGEHPSRF